MINGVISRYGINYTCFGFRAKFRLHKHIRQLSFTFASTLSFTRVICITLEFLQISPLSSNDWPHLRPRDLPTGHAFLCSKFAKPYRRFLVKRVKWITKLEYTSPTLIRTRIIHAIRINSKTLELSIALRECHRLLYVSRIYFPQLFTILQFLHRNISRTGTERYYEINRGPHSPIL